jgi:ribosomal protein S15P/S13E
MFEGTQLLSGVQIYFLVNKLKYLHAHTVEHLKNLVPYTQNVDFKVYTWCPKTIIFQIETHMIIK